ncbi:MAG: hypothetical protein HC838_09195, partial [Spirulinaceae cyanobacterium RM2_2_10]|nr:hypothetical protein [Spirulinaceae cyanobacterium RM2_2_10]
RHPRDRPSDNPPRAVASSTVGKPWQAELSVRWLLFLGVFLVVASSSVLAASQWSRFSPLTQYGVLWGYTIVFGVAGLAASRLSNLRLTGQSLQLIALLLIPINTWAMDALGLWTSPGNWLAIALATLSLGAIAWVQRPRRPLPIVSVLLVCSVLHWGWAQPGWPQLAVYSGTIAGLGVSQWLLQQRGRRAIALLPLLGYAIATLLARALFAVGIPLVTLGFVIGSLGFWLAMPRPALALGATVRRLLLIVGGLLLAVGWVATIPTIPPWQATGISLLAVMLFVQRLRLGWRGWDLLAVFLLSGLTYGQMLWLIPDHWWQDAIAALEARTSYEFVLEAVQLGLGFAYSAAFLGSMTWLYRRQQPRLAYFGEWLAIALGASLCLWSLVQPTLLLFVCSLETLLLLAFAARRPRILTVYCAHAGVLLTLAAGFARVQPQADATAWANALVGVALVQWFVPLVSGERSLPLRLDTLRRSSWYFGLISAGLSYELLLPLAEENALTRTVAPELLGWLLVPIALSLLASRYQRAVNAAVSTGTLIVAQLLLFGTPTMRLVGLGTATLLMTLNTYWRRQPSLAFLHVTFGLAWAAAAGWSRWDAPQWLLAAALAIAALLALHAAFTRLHRRLARFYQQAVLIWRPLPALPSGMSCSSG